VVCVDDACDGNRWQAARGIANEASYWGMGAGHNCTNYVAWRMTSAGVPRPNLNPGDAADWAGNARADGYRVDNIPAVGAVAHWEGFAPGYPAEGHVAYVERVNSDGTILVSEDYWRADGSGRLTFRTIESAGVSNFIHYIDARRYVRQVSGVATGSWVERSTGVIVNPSALAAISMGGRAPEVAYVEAGELKIARAYAPGWQVLPTGLVSSSTTLSAVNIGGSSATVVSREGNRLIVSAESPLGWKQTDTETDITGEFSAINAGGVLPTILVSQGGLLYVVFYDGLRWQVRATGLSITGSIAAVSLGGDLIDVYAIEGGVLQRLWFDGLWWHKDSTGIAAAGSVSAVSVDGTSQAVLAEEARLFHVYRDSLGWHKIALGATAGAFVAAVEVGTIWPQVIQAG